MADTSKSMMNTGRDIDSLASELNCDNRIQCVIARKALEAKGQDAIPALVETLKNGEEMAPMHAAKALGHIGGPEAIQALVNALGTDNPGVRWAAAEALIETIPQSVKPVLKALISSNNSSFVRESAHQVLIEVLEEPMKSILEPVVKALEDGVPELEAPLQAKKALDSL